MPEHEIRVALVMNGGVSLAVWMAGVTHELDLIRRATTPGAPPAQPYDEPVAQRWKELLRPEGGAEQRRLVVDVIAGTSAGGLNGAFLATVVAQGTTLDPDAADPTALRTGPWLRQLWSDLGALDVGRLIPDKTKTTHSVLDGTFFHKQAAESIKALAKQGAADRGEPVTLFATASGLGRQGSTATDAARQQFDVTDHRFLYKFSNDKPLVYRGDGHTFERSANRGSEFADIDSIALAVRASASFPAAFAPVKENNALKQVRPPRERPRRQQPASWPDFRRW